jgi:hypothetical protein
VRKEETVTPRDRIENNTDKKFTKTPLKDTLKDKSNIKDYDRAWEDDRL